MRVDSTLQFVPYGSPLSMVGADGVAIPSTNVIDLLGSGVGTAPANIIGNASVFGQDMGVGDGLLIPKLAISPGTVTFATGNSATLNIALQLAADQGSAGSYQPSTWNTAVETGAMTLAQLNTAITNGFMLARFDWPPSFPVNLSPRYARLLFSPAASTHFTAGTIGFAVVTSVRDDQANKYAARNYAVS